jgi:hypothetical protein
MLYFRSQNKKADRGEKVLEGHLGESVHEFEDLADDQVSGIPFSRLMGRLGDFDIVGDFSMCTG